MCTHIIYACTIFWLWTQSCTYTNTGTVIEGPSNVTYLPGLTPLPIELTCDVTGIALWRVNGTSYTLLDLTNGALPGHNRTGTNILVNSPVNNTEYICLSLTSNNVTSSDPAYIFIAGEQSHVNTYTCMYVCIQTQNTKYIYVCMHTCCYVVCV